MKDYIVFDATWKDIPQYQSLSSKRKQTLTRDIAAGHKFQSM